MMRKIIILLCSISLLIGLNACKQKVQSGSTESGQADLAHNSENSLDWDGVYVGVIPCADCEGIEVTVTLYGDKRYDISYLYIDKEDSATDYTGTFEWNSSGSIITLNGLTGMPDRYKVGENRLFQLDMDGNEITGGLADKYILKKVVVNE